MVLLVEDFVVGLATVPADVEPLVVVVSLLSFVGEMMFFEVLELKSFEASSVPFRFVVIDVVEVFERLSLELSDVEVSRMLVVVVPFEISKEVSLSFVMIDVVKVSSLGVIFVDTLVVSVAVTVSAVFTEIGSVTRAHFAVKKWMGKDAQRGFLAKSVGPSTPPTSLT